jgi:uncharacterized protein (TIGR00290 family)
VVVAIVLMEIKKKRITISWSGGKDSAFALYKILRSEAYDVVSLHTVINAETKRVGMHGVREELIEHQANALGLPLVKLYLESSESHAAYEKLMLSFYQQCAEDKIEAVMFGDIFLEDLKKFREQLLVSSQLIAIFPLWNFNTTLLIQDFIHAGFKTIICSANAAYFTADVSGKIIDEKFITSFHPDVDPCGENGEFHTFVFEGPIFRQRINFKIGEIISKKYSFTKKNNDNTLTTVETEFWFQDLLSRTIL